MFVELDSCHDDVSEESKDCECPSILSFTHTENHKDAEACLEEREDNREVAHGVERHKEEFELVQICLQTLHAEEVTT